MAQHNGSNVKGDKVGALLGTELGEVGLDVGAMVGEVGVEDGVTVGVVGTTEGKSEGTAVGLDVTVHDN